MKRIFLIDEGLEVVTDENRIMMLAFIFQGVDGETYYTSIKDLEESLAKQRFKLVSTINE